MDFDYILSDDQAKDNPNQPLKEEIMETLRSFFNTSLGDIFEDEPQMHHPRASSCPRPRAMGLGSHGSAAKRGPLLDEASNAQAGARPSQGGQLRSRPSQNSASGTHKPRQVVWGQSQAFSTPDAMGTHVRQKVIKHRGSCHRNSPHFDGSTYPSHQEGFSLFDDHVGEIRNSPAGSTTESASPPSPGAGIINVVNSVVHGFSRIGMKATNLLNTLDANFDQMFNPNDEDVLDSEVLVRRAQVVEELEKLQQQQQVAGPLLSPPSHMVTETMTRDAKDPSSDAGPCMNQADHSCTHAISDATGNERASKGNQVIKQKGQHDEASIDQHGKRAVNKKLVRQKKSSAGSQPTVQVTSPPLPSIASACSSPSSEQDCPTDQKAVRHAQREKAKEALGSAETAGGPGKYNQLLARIKVLQEENDRLRAAEADPVDDAIRSQIQQLLSEKAALAEENAQLVRENRSLQELLAFTTDYAGLMVSPGCHSTELVTAQLHGDGSGLLTPVPSFPPFQLTPATSSKYTEEVAAVDSYYSSFLPPPAPSLCGWDFLDMDLDLSSITKQDTVQSSETMCPPASGSSDSCADIFPPQEELVVTNTGNCTADDCEGTATTDCEGSYPADVISPHEESATSPSATGSQEEPDHSLCEAFKWEREISN